MDNDPYAIASADDLDLPALKIGECGVVNAIPFYWPSIIECDQCEENCFEEVGYRVINGILRAFIGCNKGGRVNIRKAAIEKEMNSGHAG